MKRRKLSSTVSLALLSLSIIVFNILQLCDGYEEYNQPITAVTIMLSVLVLVLSLLVSYLNYSEREMKYYDCGLKLSALCDEIDLVLIDPQHVLMTNEELRRLKDKYQRIIGECGINHIAIDHKRAMLRIEKKAINKSQQDNPNAGDNGNADNTTPETPNPDNVAPRADCCEQIINFLKYLISRKETKTFSYNRQNRFMIWIEWNLLDVNFLYWILAFGIPVLAWFIIFKSHVFWEAIHKTGQMIPVLFSL